MSQKGLLLSDVLTLLCVASESLVFGNAIALAHDSAARSAYLMCAIPAVVFGLPIVIGVAAVRHARGGQMTWAGLDLLGVFCLLFSRLVLMGLLPVFQQILSPVGLLASQCFAFAMVAKAVHLAVPIGRSWKRGWIDCSAPVVDNVIDGLNLLSLAAEMATITPVPYEHFIGSELFLVSPTAAIGSIALIGAGFLRRTQMRNVILIDAFGSLCLLTTWWAVYYDSVQHMLRVGRALQRDLGWPVGGESIFCLVLSAPFLFLILCKFLCLALAFARGRRWTQYTLAGMLIFFAACGPLCFAAWRVGK
jgi:hypothetical protein